MPKQKSPVPPIATTSTPIVATPPKMRCSSIDSDCPTCGAPHYVQVQGDLDLDLLRSIGEAKQLQIVARSAESGGSYAILSFVTGIYSPADALRIVEEAIDLNPSLDTPNPPGVEPPVLDPEGRSDALEPELDLTME